MRPFNPGRTVAWNTRSAVRSWGWISRCAPIDPQVRTLRRGVEVVVATPGRALDHQRRNTLDLTALEVLGRDAG